MLQKPFWPKFLDVPSMLVCLSQLSLMFASKAVANEWSTFQELNPRVSSWPTHKRSTRL